MVVVATDSVIDVPSKQFTTVLSRSLLTRLIVILDIRVIFSPESLEAVNVELLMVTTGGTPGGLMDEITVIVEVIV